MRPQRRDAVAAKIAVHPAGHTGKPVWRIFPGPRDADAPVRVAIERTAYAELIAHAKESLDTEVCGVLAGQLCEDDEGRFVHVEAVVRGSAAAHGATHVTFTQATWDAIHSTLERDHPKSRIVGWYHTHPGFGVEFSEMDLFIQRNFFPGAGQIALVTDPMNGAVAIAMNSDQPGGIEYLPRFWVDAREQMAQVPARFVPPPMANETGQAETPDLTATIKALEARVGQLIQANDDQRASLQRFLFLMGFAVCLALLASAGYFIYSQYVSRMEPPRLNNYVPIPIRVGDKTVLVGVGVAQWEVPPELNALMLQMAKADREEAGKLSGGADKESTGAALPSGAEPSLPSQQNSKP